MNVRSINASLVLVALLVAAGSAQNNRDVISLKDAARSVSGQIVSTSPGVLELNADGARRRVPVEDIEQIRLYDDPPGLRGVRDAIRSGQYERALQLAEGVEVPAASRPLVREDLQFHQAWAAARLAMQGQGDVYDAARQMKSFLDAHRDSFHVFAASEVLGDLAMTLGETKAASVFYGRLTEAASPALRARGSLLQARALLSAGSVDAAAQRYQQVIQDVNGDVQSNRLRSLAQVGLAQCQARRGNHAAAIEAVREVIARHDPEDTELFAQAYNALGTCYLAAQQPQDALLAYLHVHLLFFREFDAHAEALYHLSQLWTEVGQPEEAVKARELLQSRYAGTTWSQK
jgi:tetratricopeptide (TPR) repeat protein